MKDNIDSASAAALASREGIVPVNFLWIEAKNRQTGSVEALGLWSGWDTIGAQVRVVNPLTGQWGTVTRTYHAGGGVIEWPVIPLEAELSIRTIRIVLSQINRQVLDGVVGYDAKHAPVEIHRGFLDPSTNLIVAPALRRFRGWINGAPKRIPAVGSEGGIELAVVSSTRALTLTVPIKRSDETQQRRGGDGLRRYNDVAGGWLANVHWGEAKAQSTGGGGGGAFG